MKFDKEDGWRLLEEKTINDRTLVAFYNDDQKIAGLMLFHLTDQPNQLSLRAPEAHWGFCTHMVLDMYTLKEAGEVVSLYLKDMETDNAWWEK
jgi:hypothetical protein